MEENEIIDIILEGNSSHFSHFVEQYQDMAFTIAYRIFKNRQDAEDAVQKSFVRAFHNLHTFKKKGKFSSWFYRIVYNTSISEWNRAMNQKDRFDIEQANLSHHQTADAAALLMAEEKKKQIHQALQQLPKEESVALTLYYLEENKVKDIAKIMQLTEVNVKIKLHRGRNKLKELLKK